MDVSRRTTLFRIGAAALVVALALVMLLACHGEMGTLMPVAMVCAVVLTAVVAAPLARVSISGRTSSAQLAMRRVRAGPRTPVAGAGPPPLFAGVLRV